MPDFSRIDALFIEAVGIAVALWAWLFILAPMMAKRRGIEYEEPPVFLYGGIFGGIKWFALVAFAWVGATFPLKSDLAATLPDLALPLGLALLYAAIVGGIIHGGLLLWRRMRQQSEAVVLEPLTAGAAAIRGVIVLAVLGGLVGLPWVADEFMGIDIIGPVFGNEGSTGATADLGVFLSLILTFVIFWAIPGSIAGRLEDDEVSPVWAVSPGLDFFRWISLGLVVFLSSGLLSSITPIESIATRPISIILAAALPIVLGVIYLLLWVLPMRAVASAAEEGDYIASDLLAEARFFGLAAMIKYKSRSGGRSRMASSGEKRLCPTCLRPVDDMSFYKDLRFDHCPHCQSFMPPVYSLMDYVNHQSERLKPLIEEQGPPGAINKRKRGRTEDEQGLVQDLLRAIIGLAVKDRGTDLHLIVEGDKLAVRVRTDGVLYTMISFEKVMARSLISASKVLANLDITERRKPQDGSFQIAAAGRNVDIRINTSPVADGEMAAMRLIYDQDVLGSIDKLGLNPRNASLIKKIVYSPSGLVLVTGPTGSGKSTTLYNALETIATGERNIITLEDPIEHQVKGITQMQINATKGFTFASGLKSILRQDPDVIMVGEIRDTETARMAVDASATGHLVFSTLHSTDTVATIGRLMDLQIDPRRAADVLILILAQRLLRMVCSKCVREHVVTRDEFERVGIPGCPEERYFLRRGEGCPHCHETGYYGREGIYEFFANSDELKSLIGQQAPAQLVRNRARALGMRTLLEDGLVKVLSGRSTLEELQRVTS